MNPIIFLLYIVKIEIVYLATNMNTHKPTKILRDGYKISYRVPYARGIQLHGICEMCKCTILFTTQHTYKYVRLHSGCFPKNLKYIRRNWVFCNSNCEELFSVCTYPFKHNKIGPF